ncbi:SURF1 superfamily protein [Candidatus Planktophila dulcis]|uniref:SURF1 family cytochrome oxidase biogenesis protein n=1 Tax=Candidatus Planktophila dulcis TaxID=1884914 RepID=UPI000BACBA48|nr:SURF1 family cytochrome oxidase biogenesis protein [Candidatus Planktophila dulcis]ASY14111.1 SURF1 superfamily protein [Candidatus Planktophila dulcis]
MKTTIKKTLQALLVLVLALTFIGLGVWQLQRAQDLQDYVALPIDRTIYPLLEKSAATGIVPGESIGKLVTTSGYYIATYKAPNQKDGNDVVDDWEVGLLQNETDTAILVVRGLWSQRLSSPEIAMSTRVEVVGTLLPAQNDDRAANTASQLSRLDSSILVASTDAQLFEGFILAKSEVSRSGLVDRTRITPPELTSEIPGFYWQHISYVVIWWFMALLVLWLPFYKRDDERV